MPSASAAHVMALAMFAPAPATAPPAGAKNAEVQLVVPTGGPKRCSTSRAAMMHCVQGKVGWEGKWVGGWGGAEEAGGEVVVRRVGRRRHGGEVTYEEGMHGGCTGPGGWVMCACG